MTLQKEEKMQLEMIMSKIKIIQVKSPIGRNNKQRKILVSLGLNKINRSKIISVRLYLEYISLKDIFSKDIPSKAIPIKNIVKELSL